MTLGVFNYDFLPSQHSMVILVVGLAVLLAMPIYAGMYNSQKPKVSRNIIDFAQSTKNLLCKLYL